MLTFTLLQSSQLLIALYRKLCAHAFEEQQLHEESESESSDDDNSPHVSPDLICVGDDAQFLSGDETADENSSAMMELGPAMEGADMFIIIVCVYQYSH